MKITFILNSIQISGGHKAIFEFSNHLHDRGHNVSIVYPLIPLGPVTNIRNLARKAEGSFLRLMQPNKVDWFDLKVDLIRKPTLSEKYIPDADVVIATWWETAHWVNRYSKSKGEKFYLIQHYEVWGGAKEDVDKSYRLGLRNIVNSSWLENILFNKLGVKIEALIPHAPDLDQFYPENMKKNNDRIRILMPYRNLKWKGVNDGINAFEIVRKKYHDIQLVMFGPKLGKDVPAYVEFHEKPSNNKLRAVYNSCDIFLFPSHSEGFGMPPMEAMACKCAVVTTNVGAVPDYAIPEKTCLVSPPHSPALLAENIIRLLEDSKLRKRISESGYQHIHKNFNWAASSKELEKTFLRPLNEKKILNVSMDEDPLVSIIIPCYNGQDYIGDAIESVVKQTYENWELIIVDDASTDGSKDIVRRYLFDTRINLIIQESNQGIPTTKNIGLGAAKGTYIAFLDQDDLWHYSKLKLQVKHFMSETGNIGVVCTGMEYVDNKLEIQDIFTGYRDRNQKALLKNLYLFPINSSSIMMIKREVFSLVGTFNEDLIGWDDYEMLMRIASRFEIKYVRKLLVKKRIHTKNLQTTRLVLDEAEKVSDKVVEWYPFLKKYAGLKEAKIRWNEAKRLLRQGMKDPARRQLIRSIKLNPLRLRIGLLYGLSFLPGDLPLEITRVLSIPVNWLKKARSQ